MIQANELRVGNWVNNYGQYCFVLEIYKTNKVELGYFKDSIGFIRKLDDVGIKPIPITEDILLKCGFTEITELENMDIKEYRMFNHYSFCVQFPCGAETHCYAGNYPIAIKHLHELQNLYFALTKTELKINL